MPHRKKGEVTIKMQDERDQLEFYMKLMKKYNIEELIVPGAHIIKPAKEYKPRIRDKKPTTKEKPAVFAKELDAEAFMQKYDSPPDKEKLDEVIDNDPNFEAFNRGTAIF